MVLYDLAENCNYRELKEEMIRDRLVIGIRDNALSENFSQTPSSPWRQRKLLFNKRKLSVNSNAGS